MARLLIGWDNACLLKILLKSSLELGGLEITRSETIDFVSWRIADDVDSATPSEKSIATG